MPRKQKEPVSGTGKCVSYLRVSTGHQGKTGLGLMAQSETCDRVAKRHGLFFRDDVHCDTLKPPRLGVFVDSGTSAFSTPFAQRNAGSKLLAAVNPGDSLIVARLDRAFRSIVDFVLTSQQLAEMNVRLICCNPPLDLGSATGRMLANVIAVVAQWESERKSERIKEALDIKRALASDCELVSPTRRRKSMSVESDWRPIDDPDEPVEHKPGRIFMYIRCSHRDSAESGLGLLSQIKIAEEYAGRLIEDNPQLSLMSVCTDAGVSAFKTNLRFRGGGSAMDKELQEGDHVVISTIDRGFRSLQDMATTIKDWKERGIHLHFAADGISMDDAGGRQMAQIICMFAEFEAELIQDRNRESRAQLAAQGKFCGGREPPFWRVEKQFNGVRYVKKLVFHTQRLVMYRLINTYIARGMTKNDALIRAEAVLAAKQKRPALPLSGVNKGSVLAGQLDRDYERDMNGRAYPMFTLDRFNSAKRHYPKAVEDWRKFRAEVRRLRELKNVPPVPIGKRGNRGWDKDNGVTFQPGSRSTAETDTAG